MRSYLLLLLVLYGCTPSGGTEPPQDRIIDLAGQLEDRRIVEASGLTASGRRDDTLWTHNDGGKAIVHAIGLAGETVGQLRIDKVKNRDWEDIATAVIDDLP